MGKVTKRCSKPGCTYKHRAKGLCKDHYDKEYIQTWYSRLSPREKEDYIARVRARQEPIKAAVIAHYGGKCRRCGETENLKLHHVNGDGARHRAEVKRIGMAFLEKLVRDKFLTAYPMELLCHRHHVEADRELRQRKKLKVAA